MYRIALQMLVYDTNKYIGIVFGVMFASLIMTQQPAIFVGIMKRTYAFITDVPIPDLWVMDDKVQFVEDNKRLRDTEILRIRSIEGVDWATPIYKGVMPAKTTDGTFQSCNVIGIDDATLMGGPLDMVEGSLRNLFQTDAVIVDVDGTRLLKRKDINGKICPLKVGDTFEINDHRAVVVGLTRVTRPFQTLPVVYTTFSRAVQFAPTNRLTTSFILAGVSKGANVQEVSHRIHEKTGLKALSQDAFKKMTMNYYLKNTGIPINFGIAVLLGFLVGAAVAGQMFYNFTHENMKQFAALKAMGCSNATLTRMILSQAFVVGCIGWGLGVGLATLFGIVTRGGMLAFSLVGEILILSSLGVFVIVSISALISIVKVRRLEAALVFKG